ncbi:MAG: Rne/Rng family ribonuclease [Pseudomonadota bacterium]
MAKKMLIDATHAEETRVVVVDGNKVEEFDFESENKRQLAGNIYLAKVTRVEPSLQAAFVDYGGNRHGFLAFSEIHPDYYQIPIADRERLLAEEAEYARQQAEDEARREAEAEKPRSRRTRRPSKSKAASGGTSDDVISSDIIDLEEAESGLVDVPEDGSGSEKPADHSAALSEAAELQENQDTEKTAEIATLDGQAAGNLQAGKVQTADSDAGHASGDAQNVNFSIQEEEVEENYEAAQKAESPVAEQLDDAAMEEDSEAAADESQSAYDDESAVTQMGDGNILQAEATLDKAATEQVDASGALASAETLDAEAVKAEDAAAGSDDDEADEDDGVETQEEDDVRSEVRPRKPRPRRYKIQEVIKVRQILLVQVVKEERGNKGAALTTYLSLAGRYCVLMPNTARGGGISRKITNAADRKKLKEIAGGIEVPEGAGLIVRTAGAKRTKTEIKRDYEYLLRQWEQIRDLTLKSIAPAKIYEEGNLIKRSIRDLYNRDIDEVFVEGEGGYREAKEYMKMLMPSHAARVKHYTEAMPLYARYQVEGYLDAMFNPTVQLRSGGYIVIGITEALVAIDVNSGKATKEGSIEETALRTNLEAADEVARQLKLRDLAGLIVIDFIDMEERRNNSSVEKRMKERLKNDRARIQVGRISTFGLMEMSRQRLRPGMIEATTQPCPACHGTGLIRSDDSQALSILRTLEEEGTRKKSREVVVTAPVGIANYLLNEKREHIAMIEMRYGMVIRINADPMLISPDFKVEKFKTSSRPVPKSDGQAVTIDSVEPVEEEEEDVAEKPDVAEETDEDRPKKKRRRRRRRRGGGGGDQQQQGENAKGSEEPTDASPETEAEVAEDTAEEEKPKRRSRGRGRGTKSVEAEAGADTSVEAEEPATDQGEVLADVEASADADPVADTEAEPAPEEKPKKTRRRSTKTKAAAATDEAEATAPAQEAAEEKPKPKRSRKKKAEPAPEEEVAAAPKAAPEPAVAEEPTPTPEPVAEKAPEPEPVAATPEPESAPEEPPKPKRRGWWSRG